MPLVQKLLSLPFALGILCMLARMPPSLSTALQHLRIGKLTPNGFAVRARQQLCPLDSAPKNCHVQTAVAQRSPHIATFPYIATPNSVPRWGWLRSSDVLSRGMPEDVKTGR